MSVFDPIDVRVGNERRKSALQRLMQQVMSRGASARQNGSSYGGRGHFGPGFARPRVTQDQFMPPGLALALGPGGHTPAIPGVSASPGQGIPVAPPVPVPLPPQAGPPNLPVAPPGAPVDPGPPTSPGQQLVDLVSPGQTAVGGEVGGMIPVSPGVWYDPINEVFHGAGN